MLLKLVATARRSASVGDFRPALAKALEVAQALKHRLKVKEKHPAVNEPIPNYGK